MERTIIEAALEGLRSKATQINEAIKEFEGQLAQIDGNYRPAVAARPGARRVLSPEVRERMAAAQKARWEKAKEPKKRPQMSADARNRIAAAQKKRWADLRKAQAQKAAPKRRAVAKKVAPPKPAEPKVEAPKEAQA